MSVLTIVFQITLLMSLAMSASLDSRINIQRGTAVAVGEVAPDFTLEDQNGRKVSLSDARGKSAAVLVFYRGYW